MDTIAYICLSFAVVILVGLLTFCFLRNVNVIAESRKDLSTIKSSVFPLLLSAIAIIISLISIAIVCPKASVHLAMDYYDVIIAILSILVTILLGWQIYTVIRFEEQVEKAEGAIGKSDEAMAKSVEAIKNAEDAMKKIKDAGCRFEQLQNETEQKYKKLQDDIEEALKLI